MKLYTFKAPNAFRVHAFLKEKGVDVPAKTVNLMEGAGRTPEFLAINSLGEIPVLELDDGTHLTESVAICRYFEAHHPEPPLFGKTPEEAAKVEMWNRRMEFHVLGPIGEVGRHTFQFFADKMEQIPTYADSQRRLMRKKWAWLNDELSDGRTFVCNDAFSIADITGMAALMICQFADESVPGDLAHVKRWEKAVRARPSWEV
ncbi:MAG: glutathione S-transferase family protein [Pseudomonadota bacterium]